MSENWPAVAVALDGLVDLDATVDALPWPATRRTPYGTRHELPDDVVLWIFDFGAFTLLGQREASPAQVMTIERATRRSLLMTTLDAWTVEENPEQRSPNPRVGWDQIEVRRLSTEQESAVALLLGQSAALERHEQGADQLIQEVEDLARTLQHRGRLPRRTSELSKKIGRITADKLTLAGWFYLDDRPEETWTHEEVAQLYDALFQNLELRTRHQAMLNKLENVQNALQTMTDLWFGRQGHMLEWAIVLLIVAEIGMLLAGIG